MMVRTVAVSKRALLLCVFCAVAFSALPAVSQTVIPIGSYADLNRIGVDIANFPLNGVYELTADIDASPSRAAGGGDGFTPIGSSDRPFTGRFDGKGHTISGLFINRPSLPAGRNVGLFGFTDSAAISNVIIEADSIAGVTMVGILAGRVDNSVIDGCVVSGKVSGQTNNIGGLIGAAYNSVITGSGSAGAVYGRADRVGGLVGFAVNGEINASYSSSSVEILDWSTVRRVGGLIGSSETQTVTGSYSTGSVTNLYGYGSQVGGLIGYSSSTVTGCHSTAALNVRVSRVGGLIGENHGTVTHSYYERPRGSVRGTVDVGGLIGANERGAVANSRATVSVFGDSTVGGLIGGNYGGSVERSRYETDIVVDTFEIEGNMVITTRVTDSINGTGRRIGGLIGSNHGTVKRSHANSVVNGRSHVGGLVGLNEDTLAMCYSTGIVNAGEAVGGLVGTNFSGAIIQCYSLSSVTGTSSVGGLVGVHYRNFFTPGLIITESYSAGRVVGSDADRVGGLVGFALEPASIVRSCWDIEASGQSRSAGGEGRNTGLMQHAFFGVDLDWDFVNVWQRVPNGYPRFIYQSEPDPVSVFRDRPFRRASASAFVPKVAIRGRVMSVTAPAGVNYMVRLLDMRGRVVARFRVNGSGNFPLGRLPAGRYLVETRANGKIISVSSHNI
jgi:hypothetical protein